MGISTEDKYLIKSLPENKKYGAKRLLICFLTKTGVLMDWKRWSKNWQHRYCWSTSHCPHSTCVVNFLIRAFIPSRLQFLLGNSLGNRFAPYFLFSRKDLIK